MTLLWEKFISIMSHLLDEYKALLSLNIEKRQVLINADVKGLTDITKQEEIFVLKINKLEGQRQAVVKEIAAAAQNGEPCALELAKSISGLKKLAGEKYAGLIEQFGAQLLDSVKQLEVLNGLNAKLISQHLEFIEFNINVLSSASCEQTYSANPGDSQVKRRSLFNTQA